MTSSTTAHETLPEGTLRELCVAAAALSIQVVGMKGGGFIVRLMYGAAEHRIEKVLGTTRGGVRRFGSLDTVALFLRELGCPDFTVDMSGYEPGLVRPPRPDRAEALKKTRTSPRQESLLL